MRKLFLLALSCALLLCSCGEEKYDSRILSVEEGDGYSLVTSEVYPGQGDTLKVWIALPAGDWDGRLVGTGGSGPVGGKASNAISWARKGMVGVATNCGHDCNDYSFFYDSASSSLDEVQARDFGHYALHVMTVYAKRYLRERYGRDPEYCYFTGSSTGGRHALQVAQKYPRDYDAVFSGCPAWHNDTYVPARAWAQVVMYNERHLMPFSKFDFVRKAIIAAEDPLDGLEDGIVNNPFEVKFDIGGLVGMKDAAGDVFTAEDARVIRMILDGCSLEDGKLWYFFTPTTDYHRVATCDGDPLKGHLEGATEGIIKYSVELDPDFRADTISYEKYKEIVLKGHESLSQWLSATPDLTEFRRLGHKLLIMHGLDDDMVPPGTSIRYFEDVAAQMGGYEALDDFMRLYLVPGVNHSFKGPGVNLRADAVDILIDWVENGNAPRELVRSKKSFGTRPFYPYPACTVYKGGDPDDPANFGMSMCDSESYLRESSSVRWYK